MSFQLRKASRKETKLRVGLAGTSGSGKTYSALLLANGMATWDKICLIDSENGSGDLYSHLGEYNVITLKDPFTPERYIEAIEAAEQAGMEVIVIDSMTHEWDGKGGILDIHGNLPGNSYTNWGKVTPRHNKFIEKILQSSAHIVATLRTKQDYVLNEVNGKNVPQKVGMKAITREGVDYEFTLVFDLDIKHNATASKDRTGLFMDKPQFTISQETGNALLKWSGKTDMAESELVDKVQKILNGMTATGDTVVAWKKQIQNKIDTNNLTKKEAEEIITKAQAKKSKKK